MKLFLKSIIVLLPFALITLATSVKKDGDNFTIPKSYAVSSNCSNASITTGQITVYGSEISSPTSTSFLNLGFPTSSVNVGSNISAELAPSLTRTCNHSSNTVSNTTVSTYTCSDNSIPACLINLTHLD